MIGPRPALTYHPWPYNQYDEYQKHMFDVLPGVTGWAQVNGRKEVPWPERIELNVWYEDLRFVKKYLAVCERCVHCEKILYNYVLRSGSIMNSIGSERNIEIISAIKELREYYSKRFGDKFSKEIEFLAIDHMYITALVRLIRAHNTESKKILKEIEKERLHMLFRCSKVW